MEAPGKEPSPARQQYLKRQHDRSEAKRKLKAECNRVFVEGYNAAVRGVESTRSPYSASIGPFADAWHRGYAKAKSSGMNVTLPLPESKKTL